MVTVLRVLRVCLISCLCLTAIFALEADEAQGVRKRERAVWLFVLVALYILVMQEI